MPSVLAFLLGECDGDALVLFEVGLDLVDPCGQLAAQWPVWPQRRHFEAACPLACICPPLDCQVEGPLRPFFDLPLPFDFGCRGPWLLGELGKELLSANATTG